jgi:hypothetical protein
MIKSETPHSPVCWRIGGVVASVLLLSSILLVTTALNAPNWFTFELSGRSYSFGLFYCDICPDKHADYSTDCFSSYDCVLNSNSNLCKLGKTTYEAGISYFWLTFISLVCSLFLLERLLFMLIRRDYGHVKIAYFLAGAVPCLQVVAVIVWFSRTRASFNGSCSAEHNDDVDLCADSGSAIAIAGACLGVVASGVTALVIKFRDVTLDEGVTSIANGKIMGISHRQWLLVKVAPIMIIGLAFQLMATCWHWVNYDSDYEHKAYLLYVESYLDFDKLGFNCLYGPSCASDKQYHIELRQCSAFKRIWRAGFAYIYIDTASFIFCLFWLEGLIYFAIKREFGLPIVQYSWPVLTVLLHVIAMATWFIMSEAKFGNSCDVFATDDDIDFCADKSPNFSIWSFICYFFSALFYILLYLRRREEGELDGLVLDESQIKMKKQPAMPDQALGIRRKSDLDETLDQRTSIDTRNTKVRPYSGTTYASKPSMLKIDEEIPLSGRKITMNTVGKMLPEELECFVCRDT